MGSSYGSHQARRPTVQVFGREVKIMPDQNPTTLGAGMSDEEQYRLSDKTQLKQVKDSMNQTTVRPLHNYEVLGQQMITYLCLTYGREPTQVEFEKIWNAFDDAAEEIYE